MPQKGYYSLLQFCPDASRAEAVNVGVVLFCPDVGYRGVLTTKEHRRAEMLFGPESVVGLDEATAAMRNRIASETFRNVADFQHFVDTRANSLRLTRPRSVKVFDPDRALRTLFETLVKTTQGGLPQ